MSRASNKQVYKAKDFPCHILPRTLRTSILEHLRKKNINTKTVSVITSSNSNYRPNYVPITMDMLLELRELYGKKIKTIERAITIMSGEDDPLDINRMPNNRYDLMCGFVKNTFNVMNTTQKAKYRLIRFYGKGNLYKGWIKYKKKIDDMSTVVVEYGMNYETVTAYSRDIYPYYGGKSRYIPMYFLRRVENNTYGDNYTMKTYRCLLKTIKAIRQIERIKNERD